MNNNFDVVVIGGGHAGCEAAHASAKIGKRTCLITSNLNKVASAPCNPSVGGPAKGVVTREVDALGGLMGKVTDLAKIQIKMLNSSKGPAVRCLRAQIDKDQYPQIMLNELKNTSNLTLIEANVKQLTFNDIKDEIEYVLLDDNTQIYGKKYILTTGTYLDSYTIKGDQKVHEGPNHTFTNTSLSNSLKEAGLDLFRLKTGTPARIYADSIDFSKAELMPGDQDDLAFSFFNPTYLKKEDEVDCWLIHTNEKVHKIIRDNISKSAMYSGVIEGVGPRYCPSIEDKLVRFPDKERHQLFLEPETKECETIYIQGFSTSMPEEIQDLMIHALPGMENARIQKYGYAIEYDALRPEQLNADLSLKKIKNMYSAGQINGTSGYEEAAGQGIVAGINAALSCDNKSSIILNRTNSYIGLMIDDIITKGTNEPYRLLTSRSEYRLYLRHDNADIRLSRIGYEAGLLSEENYLLVEEKITDLEKIKNTLKALIVTPKNFIKDLAEKYNTQPLQHGISAYDFIKRPNISSELICNLFDIEVHNAEYYSLIDTDIKYEGYINKVKHQIENINKLYKVRIPNNLDYNEVESLALEAREKLNKIKPETIGLAAQISGINPADITALQIYLEKKKREKNENNI